jgi:hypothetical protein
MQNEAGVCEQPALNHGRLVGRGAIEDHVHLEFGGDFTVEGLEELLELDRAMASV